MKKYLLRSTPALVLVCALVAASDAPAQFTVLHNFASAEGSNAGNTLALTGNTLYGAATNGGISNNGTVFKLDTDGSGFNALRTFATSDGRLPESGLTPSGSVFYGSNFQGGGPSGGEGVVYRINSDGTGYAILHQFTTANQVNGRGPNSDLLLSGGTLYGETFSGGVNGNGSIYKMNTDSSGFSVLHSFATAEGIAPRGNVLLSGNTLYGTTTNGGAGGGGSIYKVNTDGTGFQVLHAFNSGTDGSAPQSGLVLSGSKLFGTTSVGGNSADGTIFSMNSDGSAYSVLHTFGSPTTDGAQPYAGLVLSGSTLYGTTMLGGAGTGLHNGTIFQIDTDGSDYAVLHSFSTADGTKSTFGNLILDDFTLYGTTTTQGATGNGTVYSLAVPEPSTLVELACG